MTHILLAATLMLCGCQSGPALDEKPMAAPPKVTTPVAEEPKATVGETKGAQDGQAPAAAQKQDEHRFVPERQFQVDKLQKATIKIEKHVFHLWVMDSDAKRREGMMFLKNTDFKDDEGMIFVFLGEGSEPRRFWMRNTLVDLDVCYCDKDGTINSVYTMKSLDETTDYSSKRPSMYVIELRAGILKKLGIKPGMRFEIPEDVVSKDDGND